MLPYHMWHVSGQMLIVLSVGHNVCKAVYHGTRNNMLVGTSQHQYLTVLCVNQQFRSGGEGRFHSAIQADLDKISRYDLLIRMGYLNAKVG